VLDTDCASPDKPLRARRRRGLGKGESRFAAVYQIYIKSIGNAPGPPQSGNPKRQRNSWRAIEVQGAAAHTWRSNVTRIEAIIRPSKLDKVKDALQSVDVKAMTVSETKGFGRTEGRKEISRGSAYSVDFEAKVKIEIVVLETVAARVIEAIQSSANTGKVDDGKIFVSDVREAVRIRTGENGEEALEGHSNQMKERAFKEAVELFFFIDH
jgi:nitrogen regulatory protein P-II 1